MARSRRGSGQGALSLLSFQDIITSLSGIMILLVLLLALDISPEKTSSAPPAQPPVSDTPAPTVFVPENHKFRPLLVECSGTNIQAGFWDSSSPDIFSADETGRNAFVNSLHRLDKTKESVFFLIKPSAADFIMQLIKRVENLDLNVGYDPMLESGSVGNFIRSSGDGQ